MENTQPTTAREKLDQWLDDHGARELWVATSKQPYRKVIAYNVQGHTVLVVELGDGSRFFEARSSGTLNIADGLGFLDDLVDESVDDSAPAYSLHQSILSDAKDPADRKVVGWQFDQGGFVNLEFTRQTAAHRANKNGCPYRIIRHRTIMRVQEVVEPEGQEA